MIKPLIAALIAATALVPASALAQDRHRGDRESRSGNWSNNQGQGQRQWRGNSDSGDRGNWRARSQAPAATPAPAPAPQVQQSRRQWNGGGQQGQQQQQVRRQWNGGQQGQQAQGQQGRRQWNGGQQGQQQQVRRGGNWNGGQQAQQQQFRRDRDRSWNGGRNNGGNWNGRNNGGNSRWSNNWRGDNRYNWRDYRSHNRNNYRMPRYYAPRGYGYGYSRFSIGATIGSLLFGQQYWINDPYYYRLPPAYGQYRWVRYYNDALLVDIYSGEVVDIEYDIFW